MSFSATVRQQVRLRAAYHCEYCLLPEIVSILPHQIDHIIATQHGGSDQLNNLCLCCIRCNLKKGPNIASIDTQSNLDSPQIVPLFHPRQQNWHDHFFLERQGSIKGLTPEGRATTYLLAFNTLERIQIRLLVGCLQMS